MLYSPHTRPSQMFTSPILCARSPAHSWRMGVASCKQGGGDSLSPQMPCTHTHKLFSLFPPHPPDLPSSPAAPSLHTRRPAAPSLLPLQLEEEDAPQQAAAYRSQLFDLSVDHLGRSRPEQCPICFEAFNPQQPTPRAPKAAAESAGEAEGGGEGGGEGEGAAPDPRLLVLSCLHCFHRRCWEQWSETQETCPCCKAPQPLM